MSEAPRVLGLILAGGLSRRMGGGDKPLMTVGGRSILSRVIARMAPQCESLALNANGDPARFAGFGMPVIADSVAGFAGPLAGILAGLDFAASERRGIDWVVSVAADCPFLPRDLVARLQSAREKAGAEMACAASGGWSHPVIGLWPVHVRDALRHALIDEDIRKIDLWTARYALVTAEWSTAPFDPFFNANTPADVAAAEAIAALHPEA